MQMHVRLTVRSKPRTVIHSLEAWRMSGKVRRNKQLYQRQIEATDRQIDVLVPAQQQAGASCMG